MTYDDVHALLLQNDRKEDWGLARLATKEVLFCLADVNLRLELSIEKRYRDTLPAMWMLVVYSSTPIADIRVAPLAHDDQMPYADLTELIAAAISSMRLVSS